MPNNWPDEPRPWHATLGCSPAGPGCDRCYSATKLHRLAAREVEDGLPVQGLTRLRPDNPERCEWTGAVRDNDCDGNALESGSRHGAFVVSPDSDLLHPAVPDEWIRRAFKAMARHDKNTYYLLTKRPERLLDISRRLVVFQDRVEFSTERGRLLLPVAKHIRVGVSAENQETFNQRLAILGEVNSPSKFYRKQAYGVKWLVIGGEGGRGSRPCHLEWVAALLADAHKFAVPALVNSLGTNTWASGMRSDDPTNNVNNWPICIHSYQGFPQ
jgi:protein gp37